MEYYLASPLVRTPPNGNRVALHNTHRIKQYWTRGSSTDTVRVCPPGSGMLMQQIDQSRSREQRHVAAVNMSYETKRLLLSTTSNRLFSKRFPSSEVSLEENTPMFPAFLDEKKKGKSRKRLFDKIKKRRESQGKGYSIITASTVTIFRLTLAHSLTSTDRRHNDRQKKKESRCKEPKHKHRHAPQQ